MSPTHSEQPWLVATSRITERLCALPAVATPDWCDRAARCFLPIVERGVVAVLIGTLTPQGGIEEREAVGAATDAPADLGGEGHLSNMVRSRTDRLPSLGFPLTADALDRGFCTTADRATIPRDWRAGPLGRMWSEIPSIELLVAATPIGSRVSGRSVVVMIGRPDSSSASAREGVLSACMSVLGKRGLLAIGPARTTSADWLTSREQLVLERITTGMSVSDIAAEIGRSAHTVHDHVKSLHRKLMASTRGELVSRALGHIAELKPKPARKKAIKAPASAVVDSDAAESHPNQSSSDASAPRSEHRVHEVKPSARSSQPLDR